MKKRQMMTLSAMALLCLCATGCFKGATCTCEDSHGNSALVDPDDYGVDNCSDACWKWQGYGWSK